MGERLIESHDSFRGAHTGRDVRVHSAWSGASPFRFREWELHFPQAMRVVITGASAGIGRATAAVWGTRAALARMLHVNAGHIVQVGSALAYRNFLQMQPGSQQALQSPGWAVRFS